MKKAGAQLWILAAVFLGLGLLVVWVILTAPKNPVAMIRVVDAAGKPVAGAVIRPEGLRTKQGPYRSGWYGWGTANNHPIPTPVKTDKNGYAKVGYPKYVFEKIETGVIIVSVNHPDFVPNRPELEVTIVPPAGTPWRLWANYILDRLKHHQLVVHVDPVVLRKGAILKVTVGQDATTFGKAGLFVQISGSEDESTDFWLRPASGVVMTRRLGVGKQMLRVIGFDATNAPWFSDTVSIDAVAGQTNDIVVKLARGVSLRGTLDETVPRPVKNGRVIAHVWPKGCAPKDSPPQWHAWTKVQEDGSFEIAGLPQGDLEVLALCNGYVNTNGPGKTKMRYPQKHVVETNDLTIIVGMEPTARLEVRVMDKQGKPVKGAIVSAWPNARYGEWGAVILAGDCYNTSDNMLAEPEKKVSQWFHRVADFEGTSDENGLAVIPNLPADVKEIGVEHPQLVLPAVPTGWGDKRRDASVTLIAGKTNETSVWLEPKDASPIKHY